MNQALHEQTSASANQRAELEAIARSQRAVLWCFLAILTNNTCLVFPLVLLGDLGFVLWALLFVTVLLSGMYWCWDLASALGSAVPFLWSLGMLLPLINLLLLLLLMQSATTRLRIAGIKVGLMGARPDQFQR